MEPHPYLQLKTLLLSGYAPTHRFQTPHGPVRLSALVERLKHYFLTYKQLPSQAKRAVEIVEMYDSAEAHEVIQRSMKDYQRVFRHGPASKPRARAKR